MVFAGKTRKICIATPEYPPDQWGGLARTVFRVARHARDLGLDVHVAHLTVGTDPFVLLDENRESRMDDGIHVHRLAVAREEIPLNQRDLWECPHNLTLLMMYQSLEKLYRSERFDLLHSFFLYPVGYVTGLLARRMRVPSVLTVVGNDVKKYIFSPEKAAVCRSGLENADRIVALSRDLGEMADALTPIADKCRIIYNSVDTPEERWVPRARGNGPFRIGCAGIFKYAKGLPYLFKAVAELNRVHKVVVQLVGHVRPSERKAYEEALVKTGIGQVVQLLEPLQHPDVPKWLRSLDAFVLPSVSEGCPNILMEALASGVPSVATRTGANEELIEDHVSGLLVPWGDSASLAAALAELVENPGLGESLGTEGRGKMADFSVRRERQAWETLYRELVDS
ncbi:MAG: glycosyltransferase [Desulfomonile tiedjei]|nr:glycosyltransferase [Desulfomonile tiedjei]